jgi:hypothetical protein
MEEGDTSNIVNNIDDEEIIDFNLSQEENTEGIIEETFIDKKIFTLDSLFIVIYEEDHDIFDKLLIVTYINYEDGSIQLEDENKNNEFLFFDQEDKLILEHNNYKITSVEKVEEFLDDIDEIELLHTDDIYPEIEILVDEIKEKIFSDQEKRENLLNELIRIYKAYDNELLLLNISEMTDHILNMYKMKDEFYLDDTDNLEFIKKMIQQKDFNIPKWLIPVIDNQKKIYTDDEEELLENEDVFTRNFYEELTEKYNLIQEREDNNYKKNMEILFSYSPYRNKENIIIPYNGEYLRYCSNDNPCIGKNGPLYFDMNRTRDEVIMPKLENSNEIIVPREQLSFLGFYALPHIFLDITMNPNRLSLHELYFISDYKYSYVTMKKRLKNITKHIISEDTQKENDNLKKVIHSYILKNNNIDYDNLISILKNNLPGYTELLDSIPKFIKNKIYNYSDFKRAFIGYDLEYSKLNLKNRQIVNEMIEKNIKNYIRNYNKSVKRRVIKNVTKKKKMITNKEKISLSLSYIMNLSVIPVRNNYIKKFVSVFSREPRVNENQNYLYEKKTSDKLLCKHYLYSMNIHKDPNNFNTLKSLYGGDIEDGYITCKVCKEYICSEDFSILEGFSDSVPTTSREILETNQDDLKILTEKQTRIKKRIQKISSMFGIDLNQYDKQIIIDYYDLFNNEDLINERYGFDKAFDNHPKVKEVKNSYKFVKPAKTQKDKINNKKNKSLMIKELSSIKEYFLDCNEIFIDIFFILFLIQTSDPSYPINSKISIDLLEFEKTDSWDDIKHNILSKISMNTIDLITILLRKIIKFNKKDIFFQNIENLLYESSVYDKLPPFKNQFIRVISYILKNESINDKLKNFIENKNKANKTNYIKEYWTTYKPYYDNKIVSYINQKINSELPQIKPYLNKQAGSYNYMNISSIRSFNQAYEEPRFKSLNIPFSEIMKNESYERLFKYSMQLHGKTKTSSIINLHILRFINTVKDDRIPAMLNNIGWNNSFKKTDNNNYSDFRKLFVIDIINHFQTKNPNDSDTIKIYFHFNVNNWNGFLLNSYPKRNYSYIPPTIFPNESFDVLLTTGDEKNFINELFRRFCINEEGDIIPRYSNDDFIMNLIADPTIEREALCENNITKTKENFEKILEYKRKSKSLSIFNIKKKDTSVESRIKYYIKNNNLLKRDYEELFPLLRQLAYDKRCCESGELRKIFNEISKNNAIMMNTIQGFFVNNDYIDKKDKDRFKSNFGRNIESLSVLLNKFLEKTDKLPTLINNSLQLISRLSTNVYSSKNIPKNWKLSDTNIDHFKNFLDKNQDLFHYDIFIPIKENIMDGYYIYQNDKKYSICFQGLLKHIKKYFKQDISTIIGSDNSKVTKDYNDIFNRYIFLFLFYLMIEYINDLKDEDSQISSEANLLFTSLEEQDRLDRYDTIKTCTTFSFNLLVDLFEEYTDTNWIYQTNLLTDKISRQKEREKQQIIDTLESKTSDDRLVTVQKQKCGLSNYFHQATKKNLSHIQTEDYKTKLNDERSDFAKEFFSQYTSEIEIMEGEGVNTALLHPDQMIPEEDFAEESYDQHDIDRESEGDDDGDEEGNYREN